MLKRLLESKIGQSVSNTEFEAVMEMATEDIKFNKISFNKRTGPEEMLLIAARCTMALKKCL